MFNRQKSFDVYTISIKFYYQASKRSEREKPQLKPHLNSGLASC